MIKKAIPVIMFHSVGIPNKNWQWSHLTCPYNVFESQLRWMKKKGFHTISLQHLYNYMKEESSLPKNPVVITFDDGYLDNWIFAYPLLKKYGFEGTVYVNPEFVDPQNIIRKNLKDVWENKVKIEQLETKGYLSWEEMRTMEKEGVMDIQSHALTHTWYFKNNNIIDFRHPNDPYIWMTWNNHTDKKPSLHIDKEELIDFGEPVYEFGKSLETKKYFPNKNLDKILIEYVNEKGGKKFFKNKDWKKKLFAISKKYKEENQLDDWIETEKDYQKRVYLELKKSKEIIEKKLNKEVNFLCWPGGGVNENTLKIASEIGYISSTYPSRERKKFKNTYGEDPSRIKRMGATLYWDGKNGHNSKIKYKSGFIFYISLNNFKETKINALFSRVIQVTMSNLYKIFYKLSWLEK